MRSPPVILGKNGAQFGNVGETVHIHCETESVPSASRFSWSFNGKDISGDGENEEMFSIIETRDGPRVKSTVIIKDAKKHHFGEYLCSVENEIGQTESVIKLREIGEVFTMTTLAATTLHVLLSFGHVCLNEF